MNGRGLLFAAALAGGWLSAPAEARTGGGTTTGADPDTAFTAGGIGIMSWKSPAMTVIRVPDTLSFLYLPRNNASVDSVARGYGLRCLINGSYFSGVRGDASHAGLLCYHGRLLAPPLSDRQLTHVVRINSAAHRVDFFTAQSYVPAADPGLVEFQTGPLIIENGKIRKELIDSSLNGRTKHARTLLATLDNRLCFFVTVTEKVGLYEIAGFLRRIDAFQKGKLDVVNLDGGSSVALYVRDATAVNFNEADRLPVLIGFH